MIMICNVVKSVIEREMFETFDLRPRRLRPLNGTMNSSTASPRSIID